MQNIKVTLRSHTPLWVAAKAIRTCWDSGEKSDSQCYDDLYADDREWIDCGPKDRALIDRVGNQNKHSSTLEHLYYNFEIKNISRALLQELARHRIASLSVKSTRYTLKELKELDTFEVPRLSDIGWENSIIFKTALNISVKYITLTGEPLVDLFSVQALANLMRVLKEGISNDKAKYCLPESYRTELAWSINARALQNFLSLRTSPAALLEIRILADMIFKALPHDHKYLFEQNMYREIK